jgi:two-component system sensor histidine kinase KdpD
MFRPFQRLDDVSQSTGVGLGLAVARGFVSAMGGSLAAEETPGGGLTMVIRLPLSTGHDAAGNDAGATLAVGGSWPFHLLAFHLPYLHRRLPSDGRPRCR